MTIVVDNNQGINDRYHQLQILTIDNLESRQEINIKIRVECGLEW